MSHGPERVLDELLVMRCQDGDAEAFETLVGRWQKRLWRHARRLTDDHAAAWDVVQETWLAMVKGIRRLRDPATFGPWAYGIVSRKCADRVRRRTRERRLEAGLRERVEASDERFRRDDDDRAETLASAVRRLTGDQQAILSLRYAEGFSIRQIAEALDLPEGTVKSRLHHARAELKRLAEGE